MPGKISLSESNIEFIRLAFSHFFPEDTIYSSDKPFSSGEFNWKNRADFIDFVYRLTGVLIKSEKDIENIKKAQFAVEDLASTEEKQTESNLPDKEARERQEEERLKREESLKKAQEQADKQINESIKRKQEISERELKAEKIKAAFEKQIYEQNSIQESLKNLKIYAKVETPLYKEPSETSKALISQATNHPQSFKQEISDVVREKISKGNFGKVMSNEEISFWSEKTATDVIYAINNPKEITNKTFQSAILKSLSQDNNAIVNVVDNPLATKLLSNASGDLAIAQDSIKFSREIISSINKDLAVSIFGPDIEEIKVTFSPRPIENQTHEIDLEKLNSGYINLLKSESEITGRISGITKGEAKNFLLGQARNVLDTQISKLPTDNVIAGIYQSPVAQKVLESVGLSKAAPLSESFVGGLVLRIPGASPFLESIGGLVGVDLVGPVTVEAARIAVESLAVASETAGVIETGISVAGTAALQAETQAATKLATTAGVAGKVNLNIALGNAIAKGASSIAARLGFTAASAKIGAAVGTGIIPVIGTIVGTVIGAIFGKVIDKINWKKVKEWAAPIIGTVTGLVILPFFGLATSVVVGTGVTFVAIGLGAGAGGITLGVIGAGFVTFISKSARTFLITAGLPLVIFLMSFPVLVVLILFIINSGAYIVPPMISVFGNISSPYIGITKTPKPAGPFQNSELPKTITYEISITAKKGTLTNVVIAYDCQVISSGQQNCPSVSGIPTMVDNISPSVPYTFSYTATYDQNYKDSAIIDTISVTADSIEQKGATSNTSATVTFGNPPISCPLPGGGPANSMNYSYNSQTNTGHGSTQYWTMMGQPYYRYPLPQLTSCFHPSDCSEYGYAYDVFPSGSVAVFAPTVLGKTSTWNLTATFTNPGSGYSLIYTDSSGSFTIVLTHVSSSNAPSTVSSGTQVTTLFDQGSNTHLHMEFQVNGRWVKPENYFCK